MTTTTMHRSLCRSCDAPVFWARFKGTGTRSPIDYDPTDDGNLLVVGWSAQGEPLVDVFSGEEALFDPPARYTNHFATCPDRDTWRKKKR
jgi:hypothetical protein